MNPKTEKFAKKLWQATMRGCTIAVAVLLLFFLVTSLSVDYTPGMNFISLLVLVLFSLSISYSGGLMAFNAIPITVRHLLRFFVLGLAFFFVLLATTRAYFVGFILYAVVYALCLAVSLLLRRIFQKEKNAEAHEAPYESRFS